MTARAATGGFPYPGRTVAEVEADRAAILSHCMSSMKGPRDSNDKRAGVSKDTGLHGLKIMAVAPLTPCPHCGDRGFCGHLGRLAA